MPDPRSVAGVSDERLSDTLGNWLHGDGDKSLGGMLDLFGEKSFALLFVLLMALPATPIPTGGAAHVFELITAIAALQLIVGRKAIWIPTRWRGLAIAGDGDGKLDRVLLRVIRWLERISRPRLTFLFGHRATNVIFGLLVITGAAGSFFAPPFTGLDTLIALGVVLLSLAVLMSDAAIAIAAVVIMGLGLTLEIFLGRAIVHLLGGLF